MSPIFKLLYSHCELKECRIFECQDNFLGTHALTKIRITGVNFWELCQYDETRDIIRKKLISVQ